jgi:Sulfotransferase family
LRANVMPERPIPNFFIAGAPKAGTTSLYHHLSQHPEIYMSRVKEPSFFSLETRPESFEPRYRDYFHRHIEALRKDLNQGLKGYGLGGLVTQLEDYLKLFEGVREERAIGEASVFYLWSKTAAREIAAFNPAAKIVLVLRHPAERAFSQYIHYVSDGHIAHSCSEHIAACLKHDGELGLYRPFLEFGFYGEQIERLLDYIPERQVRVWLYEDTLADPMKFFRDVLAFLEVDTEFVPDMTRRYRQMQIPKVLGVSQALRRSGIWRAMRNCTPPALRPFLKKRVYHARGSLTIPAEDRRFLVQYYRDDVRRLERVIERDLSAWMQ